MVRSNYPVEAFERLQSAVASLDERTKDILAYHMVIERELDRGLAALLPRPQSIFGLGFGQKVRVFQATSDSAWTDQIAKALAAFNDLRNSAAHGDSKAQIDGRFRAACEAAGKMAGVLTPQAAVVGGLAAVIFMALTVDIDERSRHPISGH